MPSEITLPEAFRRLAKSQLNVLNIIYMATDCSNKVYDYATLHHKQRPIAEAMPELVTFIDGCVPVDGDGFTPDTYTEGRGYRLTNAGYEALTAHSPAEYPADQRHRRFYLAAEATKKGEQQA